MAIFISQLYILIYQFYIYSVLIFLFINIINITCSVHIMLLVYLKSYDFRADHLSLDTQLKEFFSREIAFLVAYSSLYLLILITTVSGSSYRSSKRLVSATDRDN